MPILNPMLRFSPEECAEPVLRALLDKYRNSRRGRTGMGPREYSIRYHKLVHELARATVTEEKRGRRLLERLRAANLIRWDPTPLQHDQIKTIYIPQTSENDLFAAVDETPPGVARGNVTETLSRHLPGLDGHPYKAEWKAVLLQAISDVGSGRCAEGLPNDPTLHDEILSATAIVLSNRHPILIRKLSSTKLRRSKLLGERQETVERFMAQFLPPDLATLEAWQVIGILPAVLLRGPLGIEMDDGRVINELSPDSPYRIKEEILERAVRVATSAKRCLSIENLTTFHEVAELNTDDLVVHTSYPSSSVVKLLRLLPAALPMQHWGDTDPWGYDVLRVLREKTGRTIQPWRMAYRPGAGPPLTKRESAVLIRLMGDLLVADLWPELHAMIAANSKGDFEQESLPMTGA